MAIAEKKARTYLPEQFKLESWDDLAAYFTELNSREVASKEAFVAFLKDLSELEAAISENAGWRYIRMTINTADEEAANRYKTFVTEIQPLMAPEGDKLNRKIKALFEQFPIDGEAYQIYIRAIRKSIELYREANIPLQTNIQELAQEYSGIIGGMSVELDGQTYTLQQAALKLKETDRSVREATYRAISEERLSKKEELEAIFDQMVELRQQIAENADYPNFVAYKWDQMGRFDYTPEDCERFHASIASAMLPIGKDILQKRRERMGVNALRPWDLQVDPEGRKAITAFEGESELVDKSIRAFQRVDDLFGETLEQMQQRGHLDLESKKGKAPGGYNYPLYESGLPFIFMNAVGSPRDLVVMMHEGGHAVHSVLTHPLELTSFKGCPSEVAELASMSMELISMDHWELFFENEDDLVRAKREHLEDILSMLPWIAQIDAFQHWLYQNPKHSRDERRAAWEELNKRFGTGEVDYSGFEDALAYSWHRQLHLFEVPFYYIEYGMAQLGAIAVWRNYKNDPEKALKDFKAALELGYTRSIGDIYATAGIRFDFSESYLKELAAFVQSELDQLS